MTRRLRFALIAWIACALLGASAVEAQTARLLRDFNSETEQRFLRSIQSVEIDGRVVMVVDTGGGDLWAVDAAAERAVLLADTQTFTESFEESSLVGASDRFAVVQSPSGTWVTDGTAAGTRRLEIDHQAPFVGIARSHVLFEDRFSDFLLSVDLDTGEVVRGLTPLDPRQPTAHTGDGRLILQVWDAEGDRGLGVSDGTAAGTREIERFRQLRGPEAPRVDSFHLVEAGPWVYVRVEDELGQRELWVTDGTEGGTRRLPETPAEDSFLVVQPTTGRAAFMTHGPDVESPDVLWITDGSAGGTLAVTEPGAGAAPFHEGEPLWSGDRLFFAGDSPERGIEPWVAEADTGFAAPIPMEIEREDDRVTFVDFRGPSDDGAVFRWGGQRVSDFGPISFGGTFVSDGTVPGTRELATDLVPASTFFGQVPSGFLFGGEGGFFVVRTNGFDDLGLDGDAGRILERLPDGRVVFSAGGGASETYGGVGITDGTVAGTSFLPPLGPTVPRDMSFFGLVPFGGRLYFLPAHPGLTSESFWSSAGTAASTREVPWAPEERQLAVLDSSDEVLFLRSDETLWASDGTAAGTFVLAESMRVDRTLGVFGGELYFVERFAGEDILRRTDLATRSVVELARVGRIGEVTGRGAGRGGLYFFVVLTGFAQVEVWESDGTAAGTVPLFAEPERWQRLLQVGGSLYLVAQTGGVRADSTELWVSADPRTETPRRVIAADVPVTSLEEPLLAAVGSSVFFGAGDLWVSDGTELGTRRLFRRGVVDVTPGPERLAVVVDDLVEGTGRVLWTTDGTAAGTRPVTGLLGHGNLVIPAAITPVADRFVFAASDGERGVEPWITDDSPRGARLLADIAPGPTSSDPVQFVVADDDLFFTADDQRTGRELYAVSLSELDAGPPPPAGPWLETAEVPGFRFKVRITDQQGGRVTGVSEPGCIDETLCVSGALPGRSEVFARIVGPKPNGFLWPTLAKFTTSQVEVWIERTTDGLDQYYLLPGATAGGADLLPALFDRGGFPVAGLVAKETGPPIPPGSSGIVSPQVPGFRFHVRLTSQTGDELPHREEIDCIEETVCVSGSVPGRSELFLRVIGPRPNGFLWPTLVRFTTSRAEVWVEQLSTGQVQYYDLPAASPGDDRLDGLFDRQGFMP